MPEDIFLAVLVVTHNMRVEPNFSNLTSYRWEIGGRQDVAILDFIIYHTFCTEHFSNRYILNLTYIPGFLLDIFVSWMNQSDFKILSLG